MMATLHLVTVEGEPRPLPVANERRLAGAEGGDWLLYPRVGPTALPVPDECSSFV